MNHRRCNEEDYIRFLMGTQTRYSHCEAERVQPKRQGSPKHDSFTRLLRDLEPDAQRLWEESQQHVEKDKGVLIVDDSTLDKPYSKKIAPVSYHWSGKHHEVVQGINLVSLIWTKEEEHFPCDYRIYSKENGLTKNDHFKSMLLEAKNRGFDPESILFDSWYARTNNLILIRDLGWKWVTRLKKNRHVFLKEKGGMPVAVGDLAAIPNGQIVSLKGYGLIRIFHLESKDGENMDIWATNDLEMAELKLLKHAEQSWKIEVYYRAIKQHTGIEKCQCRLAVAQKNHIGFSIRAFLRMEIIRLQSGVSWLNQKVNIIRGAVRSFLDTSTA
jgi:hypothetical protein